MSASWDQDVYLEALRFAAEAHRGQTVPGTEGLPYLLHLTSVAMEVMGALQHEAVQAPDLAVTCALLHDTIEDTQVTYEQVSQQFGTAVAEGVSALSKNEALPKPERMQDSLTRIRTQPREVWMVKLADRITNLQRPPAKWSAEKRLKYWKEASMIRDALGSSSDYLRARIDQKIARYTQYLKDEN